MIIVFNIVPMPGFCFNGNHKHKTLMLTIKVVMPMLNPILTDIPCARTVQGLTPAFAVINNVSPNPNKIKPRTRYNTVMSFGFKFKAS